jgi:hypothetical protein
MYFHACHGTFPHESDQIVYYVYLNDSIFRLLRFCPHISTCSYTTAPSLHIFPLSSPVFFQPFYIQRDHVSSILQFHPFQVYCTTILTHLFKALFIHSFWLHHIVCITTAFTAHISTVLTHIFSAILYTVSSFWCDVNILSLVLF